MNNKEFFDRLLLKYKSDNTYDIEDLKRYISENYPHDDFSWLYDEIVYTYQYKTLPSVKFVKDILDESGKNIVKDKTKYDEIWSHNKEVFDSWKLWPLKKVLDRLKFINSKEEMDATDIEFWGMFSEIYQEWFHMDENDYSKEGIKDHLTDCFEYVKKGQPFVSIIEREQIKIENVFDRKEMKSVMDKPRDSRSGI